MYATAAIITFVFIVLIVIYVFRYQIFRTYDKTLFKDNSLAVAKPKEKQIPKVLYRVSPVETEMVPELTNLFDKIKKQNPDYTLVYFDDAKCIEFLKMHFEPEVLNAFNSLIPPAYKCDLMRYCILYINGGVYGDLFQDYYKPLNQIINHEKDTLVLVQDGYVPQVKLNGIQISFMASVPQNPLYRECIDKILENVKMRYYGETHLEPTGPILFSKLFRANYSNTEYKMELRQYYSHSFVHYKTGEKVIKTKSDGYNKVITGKLKYAQLWKEKKIYKIE